MSAPEAVLFVGIAMCLALLSVLVVGLLRTHADILRALHDLGVNFEARDGGAGGPRGPTPSAGRASPDFETMDGVPPPRGGPLGRSADLAGHLPGGGAGTVAVSGVAHSTLIAFLSSGCGTCAQFWSDLRESDLRRLPGEDTRIVIVTQGPDAESESVVQGLAPAGTVTLMSSAAWDDYAVPVSPYFVLVDGMQGSVVGEGSGTSWPQVVELLTQALADRNIHLGRRGTERTRSNGGDREASVDAKLRAAGIEPGDPSLYPSPGPDQP